LPVTLDSLFVLTAGGEKRRDEHLRSCKVNPETTTSSAHGARPNLERHSFMKNRSANTLALAAAFAGLLGGTTARLNAQPSQQGTPNASASSNPGVLVAQNNPTPDTTKHSCKGKNDCKGQGGGKDPGKNSCKGKGDCATDGSTPPKAS
jgi:hypothetical protein